MSPNLGVAVSPQAIVAVTLQEATERIDYLLTIGRREIALSDTELAVWRRDRLLDIRAWLTWELWDPSATVHYRRCNRRRPNLSQRSISPDRRRHPHGRMA